MFAVLARSLGPVLCSILAVTSAFTANAQELKNESDKTQILIQRLAQYRDHYERNASRMTMLDAIHMGLEKNPILARNYAQIQQKQWQAIAIQREWIPSLLAYSDTPGALGYSAERYKNSVNSTTSSTSSSSTFQANTSSYSRVQLQWTFFDPTRAPRMNASLSTIASDEFLFDVVARDLVLQVQQNYYTLQKYAALESDYRRLFAIAQAVIVSAKKNRNVGLRQSSDLSQLKSFEYSLLTQRINTHEEVLKSAAQLAASLSLQPGTLTMPADPLILNGSWDLSLQSSIDQALAMREEIKQSLATAASSAWEAKASDNSTLPSFYLRSRGGMLYGRYNAVDQSQTPSTFSTGLESDFYADAGLFFNWPLFDGGINTAEANALRKKSMQAQQQAELDRLTVTSQVQSSHATYISSLIVVDSAGDEVKVAMQALAEARHDFDNSRSNATTLVQTLETVKKAAEHYRSAVAKHNIAVAELYRYSASWPQTALSLLQKRVLHLRRQ